MIVDFRLMIVDFEAISFQRSAISESISYRRDRSELKADCRKVRS